MRGKSNQSSHAGGADESDLVSDEAIVIFMVVNFVIICQVIVLFGTGTNIINMVCFAKQGLRDPVNISLLGLTISDLLSLATLIWQNICLNPLFYESDLPFDARYIALLTAGVQHVAFTRITCWLTAFIAIERCMCIALPLQIKRILTHKRVAIINMAVYIVIYCSNVAPIYCSTRFSTLPHPRKPNTTWLGIVFTDDGPLVDKYSYIINNCFLPFTAFTSICASTCILVVILKIKSQWRRQSIAPGCSDSMSARDHKVSKMVVVISTLFIVCYTPDCVIFIGIVSVPNFSVTGSFGNFNAVLISFSYILESVNASFSILIYYSTSSKYRRSFSILIYYSTSSKYRRSFSQRFLQYFNLLQYQQQVQTLLQSTLPSVF